MMARKVMAGASGVSITSPNHPNVIGKWSMDSRSGITVFDSSPLGNDGTKTVGGTFAAGSIGDSLHLDQSPDPEYLNVSVALPTTLSGEYCFYIRYRTTDRTNVGAIFAYRDSGNALLQIFQQGGTDIRSQVRGSGGGGLGVVSATLPANNTYTFLALNFSPASREFFVNGASAGTESTALSGSVSSTKTLLGSFDNGLTIVTGNGLMGDIDEVTFFDRKLTLAEIQELDAVT